MCLQGRGLALCPVGEPDDHNVMEQKGTQLNIPDAETSPPARLSPWPPRASQNALRTRPPQPAAPRRALPPRPVAAVALRLDRFPVAATSPAAPPQGQGLLLSPPPSPGTSSGLTDAGLRSVFCLRVCMYRVTGLTVVLPTRSLRGVLLTGCFGTCQFSCRYVLRALGIPIASENVQLAIQSILSPKRKQASHPPCTRPDVVQRLTLPLFLPHSSAVWSAVCLRGGTGGPCLPTSR